MTLSEQIATIAVVMAATILTRFLPFVLLPAGRTIPPYILYLGQVLPPAVFGLLVVYCIRNVDIFTGMHGLPEFIGMTATAFLHRWKRQMLLSIGGGTALYMLLVQVAFT